MPPCLSSSLALRSQAAATSFAASLPHPAEAFESAIQGMAHRLGPLSRDLKKAAKVLRQAPKQLLESTPLRSVAMDIQRAIDTPRMAVHRVMKSKRIAAAVHRAMDFLHHAGEVAPDVPRILAHRVAKSQALRRLKDAPSLAERLGEWSSRAAESVQVKSLQKAIRCFNKGVEELTRRFNELQITEPLLEGADRLARKVANLLAGGIDIAVGVANAARQRLASPSARARAFMRPSANASAKRARVASTPLEPVAAATGQPVERASSVSEGVEAPMLPASGVQKASLVPAADTLEVTEALASTTFTIEAFEIWFAPPPPNPLYIAASDNVHAFGAQQVPDLDALLYADLIAQLVLLTAFDL